MTYVENSFYSPLTVGAFISMLSWSTDYSMSRDLNSVFSPTFCRLLLLVIKGNLGKEFQLVGTKKVEIMGPIYGTIIDKEYPFAYIWLLNHLTVYKNNNKKGFSYYDLKVEGSHCVLEKNENTCVTRLTENRNFISDHVRSHFADTASDCNSLESRSWKVKGKLFQ